MISVLAIPLMAALARASGGGLGAHVLDSHKDGGKSPFNLTWLPEALFGLCIGLVCGYEYGWIWTLPAAAWSYIFMQSGHGTFYNMKGWQSSNPDRIQKLEYIIRPIFRLFNWSIYTPRYSWFCMGLKGFLIGLPLMPFGALLAVLWPASYALKGSELGEWLSGASVGLCIVLLLTV